MLRSLTALSKNVCFSSVSTRNYAISVNTLGRRTVDTSKADKDNKSLAKVPETTEEVAPLSGVPDEQIAGRKVRIFVPSKNTMQSGSYQTHKWKIEFDNRERWENPLMGWASSGDPLSGLNLEFTNAEDAIAYCDRMGYKYELEAKKSAPLRAKSYGVNFSWNKKTRVSTK